ncbi:MAG TPA: hypothetical protein VEQ17_01585 [Steroidobacteraceae bacterium]|nr:hypothetical protein [Steroidobacteraceae bacterium]
MNAMPELNDLRQQWQGQPVPDADAAALRQRVAADTRAHTRTLVALLIGTLLIIGASVLHALRSGQPGDWFAVFYTTAFSLLVWLVAMWLSRGTWRPRDESLAACLDVSIHRCRSVIIAAPIGILLYVAGLIGSLAWRQKLLGVEWQQLLDTPAMIIAGWIGAPLYAIGMLVNARLQRRRLTFLERLRQQLGEG